MARLYVAATAGAGWRGPRLPHHRYRLGTVALPIMAMFADWRSGVPFVAYLPLYTLGVIGLSFVMSRIWLTGRGSLIPCIWLHWLVNAVGGIAFDRSLWTSRWSPKPVRSIRYRRGSHRRLPVLDEVPSATALNVTVYLCPFYVTPPQRYDSGIAGGPSTQQFTLRKAGCGGRSTSPHFLRADSHGTQNAYRLRACLDSRSGSSPAIDALTKAGCERIFTDKASGAKADRPGLADALEYARGGDALVIWKLDRLGRSIRGLIDLAAGLSSAKSTFGR